MIDFHSHILPKLDDGSQSSDMSLEMMRASFKHGVDVMVATPHFYIRQNTVEKFVEYRKASYHALKNKAEKSGEELPRVILGAEVYYFGNFYAHLDIRKLCIENTDYLLLEMPFEPWTGKVMSDIEKLIYDCKIIPIIAHLDRYLDLQKKNSYIEELFSLGAVIQMNGDYINGVLTSKNAVKLIKSNVVDLVGSDCHNMDKRPPNLDKAFKIIRAKCGEDVLERMDKRGREILNI